MSRLELITAPTDYLVTLEQLKAHLAIEHDADDTRLTLLLETARDFIEDQSNLCITEQEWRQVMPCFPSVIELEKVPVTAVEVTYYDTDNVEQTLTESDYYLIKSSHHASLVTRIQAGWPATYDRPDAVQVAITCGMAAVPGVAKQACLMLCAQWDQDREGAALKQTDLSVDRLIRSLRRGYVC